MPVVMSDWERAVWNAVIEAFEEGENATLYTLCQIFLTHRPKNVPALALMMHSLSSMFRFSECEKLIRDIGSMPNEDDQRTWSRATGAYFSRCGRHDAAERALRDAAALYALPSGDLVLDIVESVISQGKLVSALQEIDDVLANIKQVDLSEHERLELLEWRVVVLRGLGRFQDALITIDHLEALTADPARFEKLRGDIEGVCEAQSRFAKVPYN